MSTTGPRPVAGQSAHGADQPTADGATRPPSDEAPEPFRFPTLRTDEVVLLLCLPLTVAVALAGLVLTGEFGPSVFAGPGDLVTYGLPAARALHDALAAVTIGLLLLATKPIRQLMAWVQ